MTLPQLQSTKDFIALKSDPRFQALMTYLSSQRPRAKSREPHGMIQDSGKLDAYFELLERIDNAFIPFMDQPLSPDFPPYSDQPYPAGNPAKF